MPEPTGERLLLDTDVFVDHLRGARALDVGAADTAYSVVTRCELFSGASADEDGLSRLLGSFEQYAVDATTAEVAGRIRRAGRTRTADALIAATALQAGRTLVTRNARDFAAVHGLQTRAP